MFEVVTYLLVDFVEILKVVIPFYLVFDLAGDLLWR